MGITYFVHLEHGGMVEHLNEITKKMLQKIKIKKKTSKQSSEERWSTIDGGTEERRKEKERERKPENQNGEESSAFGIKNDSYL